MSKRRQYSDKEQDLLQKLKKQNESLKRENAALKKQLSRIDNSSNNIRELLIKYDHEDVESHIPDKREKWRCHGCNTGFLHYLPVFKRDQECFLRICNHCGKRTRLKPLKDDTDKSLVYVLPDKDKK